MNRRDFFGVLGGFLGLGAVVGAMEFAEAVEEVDVEGEVEAAVGYDTSSGTSSFYLPSREPEFIYLPYDFIGTIPEKWVGRVRYYGRSPYYFMGT